MRYILILILLIPATAMAQSEMVTGVATPQEVYTKVVAAAQFLSETGESGLKEFQKSGGRFVWKNTHVWVAECEKLYCLPGPKNKDIGLSLSKPKCYKTGKLYIVELCNEGMHNSHGAWIESWVPKPGFDKPQRQVSFMMPVPDMSYQVVSEVFNDSMSLEALNMISNSK